MLTLDIVVRALPPNLKSSADQALVDKINNCITDPIIAEQIRDNFISYTKVLQEGKFKTEDYLNAVMYISFQLMGYNNQESYFRTFPARHQLLVAKGTSSKDIASYVSAYNKNKLVNLVREQSLIPSWVLNQDAYQKAINTQVDLMENAASEFVRTQAANSLLTHLAKPKEVRPLINFDLRENSGMNELRDLLGKLASKQQDAIRQGTTTKDIAGQVIIEGESTEVR